MSNADSAPHGPSLLLPLPPNPVRRRRRARMAAIALVSAVAWMTALAGCDEDAACPNQDDLNACTVDKCQNGIAMHTYLGNGHPCFLGSLQGTCSAGWCIVPCNKPADCDDGRPCTKPMCKNGACVLVEPDADNPDSHIPPDGNMCTHDGCLHDEPYYWPMPEGTPCNGGKGECDNGICSSCTSAANCGANLECRSWSCKQGACVPDDELAGTPIADDIPADCLQRVCDGRGGIDKVADPKDPPLEVGPCFEWICIGWTPAIEVHIHDPCVTGIGVLGVCDEKGTCIQCLLDTDCPQWGDRCENGTCASCADNEQNGGETGIDCGGPCGACLGEECMLNQDCASGECVSTNADPPKACCNAPCDASCYRCDTSGECGFVPLGQKDDSCAGPSVACNGTGQCKTKNGYMCTSNLDCISNHCNPVTELCNP